LKSRWLARGEQSWRIIAKDVLENGAMRYVVWDDAMERECIFTIYSDKSGYQEVSKKALADQRGPVMPCGGRRSGLVPVPDDIPMGKNLKKLRLQARVRQNYIVNKFKLTNFGRYENRPPNYMYASHIKGLRRAVSFLEQRVMVK